MVQGVSYLSDWSSLKFDTAVAAALALSGGVCFLAGILTPLTSLLVVSGTIAYALAWIPAPTANLLDSKLAILNVLTTATAILFLGPGAFSLDARLFGRREIFIPHATRSRKS